MSLIEIPSSEVVTVHSDAVDACARLAELAARFWTFQCREYPLTALQAGVTTGGDDVFLEGTDDHVRRANVAGALLEELAAIECAALQPRDANTRALLARELEHLVRTVATGAHLRPSLFPFGADMTALRLGSVASIANRADAVTYLARLRAIPRAINAFVGTLRDGIASGVRYPRIVVERAVVQARAISAMPTDVNPLLDPFNRSVAAHDTLSTERTQAEAIVRDAILPAIADYAAVVEGEVGALSISTVADPDTLGGDARYRHAIDFHATIGDTPAEIHAVGLSEVARLTGEIAAVAHHAGFSGDVDSLKHQASSDPAQTLVSADALLARIESLAKRIDAHIPEIVGRVPRSTYGVRSIPEVVAGNLPPAYAQPNPADKSAAGILWVTSLPDKLPAYLHPAITLHEGWPGHLMHVALIQEQSDLPAFLRFNAIRYAACLEGWALYCEWLGEAMGFYETPLERYGRLDMEMWRACRLVVDTGLHAEGWTRERAIDFMRAHLSLPLATIEAEVDRYAGWPGQALAYQVGNITFRKLRDEAEAALGERFNARAFHDLLMEAGPVTMPILECVVRAWLDGSRASA